MRSAGACILAAVAILAVAPAVVAGGPAQRGLGGGGLIAFHSCEVYDGYMRSLLRVIRPDGSGLRLVRSFPPLGGPLECVY